MSGVDVVRWILNTSPAQGSDRLVLVALVSNADYGTAANCYPGLLTIARYSGLSVRQVRRCLRSLEDQGLIRTVIKGGPEHIRYDRRPNLYVIVGVPVSQASRPDKMSGQIDHDRTPRVTRPDIAMSANPQEQPDIERDISSDSEVLDLKESIQRIRELRRSMPP